MHKPLAAALCAVAIANIGAFFALSSQDGSEQRAIVLWWFAGMRLSFVEPVLAAFQERHPDIAVRWEEMGSIELNRRYRHEEDTITPAADLVLSSAMELQAKLVNDGYAARYDSPESDALPASSRWGDMGYGITAEPVALVYDRTNIPDAAMPRTHREPARLLADRPERFAGCVAAYDPARSSDGFLFLAQDLPTTQDTNALIEAIGRTDPRLYETSREMVDAVARAEASIADTSVGPTCAQTTESGGLHHRFNSDDANHRFPPSRR